MNIPLAVEDKVLSMRRAFFVPYHFVEQCIKISRETLLSVEHPGMQCSTGRGYGVFF